MPQTPLHLHTKLLSRRESLRHDKKAYLSAHHKLLYKVLCDLFVTLSAAFALRPKQMNMLS